MARKVTAMSAFEEGCALTAQGQLDAAAEKFLEALALDPAHFAAARELAILWARLDDADQAEYFTRCALELDPASAEMQLHLGNLLRAQGRLEEALAACLAAVELSPGYAQARNNLGNAYRDLGRAEEAVACFRKSLELDPELPEAHLNAGIAAHHDGDLERAVAHYRMALRGRPRLAQALLNLGQALDQQGKSAEAMESYASAIRVQPDLAEAHFNYSLQRLLAGDFLQGWEEYEWRWRLPEIAAAVAPPQRPLWDGSPLAGKSILLFAEQGFGDAIQFVRYALLVAQRGGKVLLRCQPELRALLASAPGVTEAFDGSQALPPFEVCSPLMSLPGVFRTTLETIPRSVPYLHPNEAALARWRERVGLRGGLRVGLVWASNSPNKTAALRSLRPEALAPLAAVPHVQFYSLQKDASLAPPAGLNIVQIEGLLDFSETAALIANLDLVISVDTAVAHLAGALGKPVWTLIRYPGEWRWLEVREDSPWYPTMRLFRQADGEPWRSVIERVAAALAAHASR